MCLLLTLFCGCNKVQNPERKKGRKDAFVYMIVPHTRQVFRVPLLVEDERWGCGVTGVCVFVCFGFKLSIFVPAELHVYLILLSAKQWVFKEPGKIKVVGFILNLVITENQRKGINKKNNREKKRLILRLITVFFFKFHSLKYISVYVDYETLCDIWTPSATSACLNNSMCHIESRQGTHSA